MMGRTKSQQESEKRRIVIFPNNFYLKIFLAIAHHKTLNRSMCGFMIIKKYVDQMSEQERQKMLRLYDRMSPEQRRHPDKF